MRITVVGLGYVGLPLYELLYKNMLYNNEVYGIDIDTNKVKHIRTQYATVYDNYNSIRNSNIVIITVPTPVTEDKKPDLSCLDTVIDNLSVNIKKGSKTIIVLESTVYPGYSDEFIKKMEKNLQFGIDFNLVYTPERISPGETDVLSEVKLVASENDEALETVIELYNSIGIKTYKILGINALKIAEMSKIFENIQRDVNIALVNEMKMYCLENRIPFSEVLNAAETKSTFKQFHPGFVGGHCIAVDPYYLLSKNIFLPVTSAARNINEAFIEHYANYIKCRAENITSKLNIMLLGITYKPNISDIRESGTLKLYNKLTSIKDVNVSMYDPYVLGTTEISDIYKADIVFFIVPHKWFYENIDFYNFKTSIEFIDVTNDMRKYDNLLEFTKRLSYYKYL